MPTSSSRIVIVDAHPIFRDALRCLLESNPAHRVVGQAGDGQTAVHVVATLRPDLLLIDFAVPELGGLDAIDRLAQDGVAVPTIVLTEVASAQDTARALRVGVRGIVLKHYETRLLFDCLEAVLAGDAWVGPGGAGDLVQVVRVLASRRQPRAYGLTKRELTIIAAVTGGATNKEVARRLGISEDTVKHHLSNVFNKTGVSSRLALALFAVKQRLIDP